MKESRKGKHKQKQRRKDRKREGRKRVLRRKSRRMKMHPYHFPGTLVAAATKRFRYAAPDKLLSFSG